MRLPLSGMTTHVQEETMPESKQGDASVLPKLFEHNTWANLKLLDFCEQLSDEQLDTTAIGGFGTIRATLRHIIGAETSYVRRVNGKLPPRPFSREEWPTFDQLKEAARWTGEELLQLALSAEKETLVIEHFPPRRVEYKLTSLIVQAINHATEHRAQIATIITQLGMEPPDMSGWMFVEEIGEFVETEEEAKASQ
jgi:uncharacterized damage-inducible protein DinB